MTEPVPTVAEAEAAVMHLKVEQATLQKELAALKERAAQINERLSRIQGYNSGEIYIATRSLEHAKLAEQWDALPVVVMIADFEGSSTIREGRLLKVTPKQIRVRTKRTRDHVRVFNRETGVAGNGGSWEPRILNLSEVLKGAERNS